MRNRFFIWTLDSAASEFQPEELLTRSAGDYGSYIYSLARELDRALVNQGITFLFTWHLDAFDDRFRDSVGVLIGDEKHQTPAYAHNVRAIFKTGGLRPNPLGATLRLAPSVAWRAALRDLRNWILSYRRRTGAPRTTAVPAFELPMGYYGLSEVPFIPFAERSVDVFFAGSVERKSGFTLRARLAARRQMLSGLEEARRRLPNLQVDYTTAGPFASPSQMLNPQAYSTRLMQAKIALCPRGNFDETFRLVEAAKTGCVAIAERLPDRWYYNDAPVIQVDRWASLPGILEPLLSDPNALAERSTQMRRWWATCLAEAAVAEFIASSLSTIPSPNGPAERTRASG